MPITLAQVSLQGDEAPRFSVLGHPVRYERYRPELGGWTEPGVNWIG